MNSTTSFLHPGDLVAFILGMGTMAGMGFIRRHEVYLHLIAKFPLLTALHLWVKIHVFKHPPDMEWRMINVVAAKLASEHTQEGGTVHPR